MRKILLSLALIVCFAATSHAKSPDTVWALGGVKLTSSDVTQTNVSIASTSAGSLLLAANADRLAFEIQVSTCGTPGLPTTKIYYAYDGAVSTTAATSSAWLDTGDENGDSWFRQPKGIIHTGTVYAQGLTNGCIAVIREWSSTSHVFR